MSSKMEFLVANGLKKKLKSKWFKVVNILLLVLIPLICNIDSVIKFFGGDFDDATNVYVVDSVGAFDSFKSIYDKSFKISLTDTEVNFINYKEDIEQIKTEIVKEEKKDVIIKIEKSEDNIIEAEITSYDLIDSSIYQSLESALNNTKTELALKKYNISQDILDKVYKNVEVNRVVLNEDANSNSELMQLIGGVSVAVFIIPFFFLITLVIQYVGAEINEEKSSKSMEIIISSVSPTIHFVSKIISTNLFVLLQSLLMVGYGFIGIVSRTLITKQSFSSSMGSDVSGMLNTFVESGMLNNIVKAIPFVIILLILSFIAYSLIAGILASITTNAEDYQQIQTPLMMILLFGYYLSIVASMYDESVFIKIMSYVPLVSSILSPVLLVQGGLATTDVLISVLILIIFILVLLKYGIKIYKAGILNYSSSKLWTKMIQSIKSK